MLGQFTIRSILVWQLLFIASFLDTKARGFLQNVLCRMHLRELSKHCYLSPLYKKHIKQYQFKNIDILERRFTKLKMTSEAAFELLEN